MGLKPFLSNRSVFPEVFTHFLDIVSKSCLIYFCVAVAAEDGNQTKCDAENSKVALTFLYAANKEAEGVSFLKLISSHAIDFLNVFLRTAFCSWGGWGLF